MIQPWQPRPQRYPFVAAVELTNLHSALQLKAETANLSMAGCDVKTRNVWVAGTVVRIRIAHKRVDFAAFGRVMYARPMFGMGIVFNEVEPLDRSVLDRWIAGLMPHSTGGADL